MFFATRLILIALFFLPSVALCAELSLDAPSEIAIEKKKEIKPIKIVAFGDSLMSGYGVSEYRDFGATLERDLLMKQYGNFKVFNKSVAGTTTGDGLKRIKEVTKTKPDIVILELGINDVFRRVPLQETYSNLSKIIIELQEQNILILLVGVHAPVTAGEEYVRKFDGMYKYLAAQYKIPLYPSFLNGVAGDPKLNLPDGIHPNQMGIKIMAESVAPIVEKMIKYLAEKRLQEASE
jgi:acyl-CoA thioesterase-1